MSFLKKIFGGNNVRGEDLVHSTDKRDYAQIALLAVFQEPRRQHDQPEQQRWSRVLPRPYMETVALFQKLGWLQQEADRWRASPITKPFLAQYQERLELEKVEAMSEVRSALASRDASAALAIRMAYEARQPLGKAAWTGDEPQMSHSTLTRQILYLKHWLLDGLDTEVVEWLKLYAAEQHLWGAYWHLDSERVPTSVQQALAQPEMDGVEASYWKAYQLVLLVENQETWQRCKGGDHVRRLQVVGPDDEYTCEQCRSLLGKQFLVARVPELPLRVCTSSRGCRCRYEPVLESYDELRGE